MSVYRDMAIDAGARFEDIDGMAAHIEECHNREMEAEHAQEQADRQREWLEDEAMIAEMEKDDEAKNKD